jgi:hypothetical protein
MLTGSIQFDQSPYVNFFPAWFSSFYINLYNHFPQFEWYFIVYYIGISASFFILFLHLYGNDWKRNAVSFALFLLYFVIYGKLLITEVHFTLLSGFLTLTACVHFTIKGAEGSKHLAIAALLFLGGMLYRYQNALLVAVVFFVTLWLYQFSIRKRIVWPSLSWSKKLLIVFLVPLTITVFTHKIVPQNIKKLNKTSASFLKIFDYKILENQETRETALRRVGWDSVEFNLFNWYIIPSSPAFSKEKIEALAEGTVQKHRDIKFSHWLKGAISFFTSMQFQFPLILSFLFVIIILYKGQVGLVIFSPIYILFIVGLLVTLKYFFKFPSLYIMVPIFSAYFFILVWHISKIDPVFWSRRTLLLILPLAIFGYVIKKNQSEFFLYIKSYLPQKSMIHDQHNGKYLVCPSMLNHDYAYPDYYSGKFYVRLDIENCYYLGPMIYHPSSKLLGNEGGDVLKWLVNNPKAVLYVNHNYNEQLVYMLPDISAYLHKTYGYNVNFISTKANSSHSGEYVQFLTKIPTNDK